MVQRTGGDHSLPEGGKRRFGAGAIGAGFFGLISGLIAGVALFDSGPGAEPPVVVLTLSAALAAVVAATWTRPGRGRS